MEIEVEVRFWVRDVGELIRRGSAAGFYPEAVRVIRDSWYVPIGVDSHEQHENWLAAGGSPVRVRETNPGADDGHVFVESKRASHLTGRRVSEEIRLTARTFEEADCFLDILGRVPIAVLSKTRRSFVRPDLPLVMAIDQYSPQETFVEIEHRDASLPPDDRLATTAALGTSLLDGIGVLMEDAVALTLIRERLLKR